MSHDYLPQHPPPTPSHFLNNPFTLSIVLPSFFSPDEPASSPLKGPLVPAPTFRSFPGSVGRIPLRVTIGR